MTSELEPVAVAALGAVPPSNVDVRVIAELAVADLVLVCFGDECGPLDPGAVDDPFRGGRWLESVDIEEAIGSGRGLRDNGASGRGQKEFEHHCMATVRIVESGDR